jgi:hypothetical protein
LLAAVVRYVRDNRRIGPASTWLLIAIIFSVVSVWLWFGGHG